MTRPLSDVLQAVTDLLATTVIEVRGAAVAVGRFRPEGVEGYRARSNPAAPLRATRAEAEADERAWLDAATKRDA